MQHQRGVKARRMHRLYACPGSVGAAGYKGCSCITATANSSSLRFIAVMPQGLLKSSIVNRAKAKELGVFEALTDKTPPLTQNRGVKTANLHLVLRTSEPSFLRRLYVDLEQTSDHQSRSSKTSVFLLRLGRPEAPSPYCFCHFGRLLTA